MKLTKLYIHNYKSFYDTTIELDKMNIVVGENNSGKSNLIDVLEFIDIAMLKDIKMAIISKGGLEKILNYNYNEKKIIIESYSVHKNSLMKTRLTFDENMERVISFFYLNRNNKVIPVYASGYRMNYSLNKKRIRDYFFKGFSKSDLSVLFDKSLPFLTKTYAFNMETIRNKSHRKLDRELTKDGENLGETLFKIKQKSSDNFEIISNSMIGIVNEIEGIDVQEVFGSYIIGFYEKNRYIGIDMVSDGTINLLATVTLLNENNNKILLLAFDEPERFLHLKAVNYLLENFRASEKQILITTHSTEILKYANLDEILFIYRDSDGDTQSIRANKIEGLKDMLKELSYERDLTLDELIADGVIGDFR
ncbi:hypothetical protein MNB_SV-13-2067 [hydrothermal vent metagenome]|uniref:ATPase AAA-type core domain-containing protein n=1 Tax=hydrothermal vent metagenome TaxID=652676 RepID=A0A1W1BYP5_9ZZZZ